MSNKLLHLRAVVLLKLETIMIEGIISSLIVLGFILGLAVFIRLFHFFKSFFIGDKTKRNIIKPENIELTQIDKELFYERMKPYFEENLVRKKYIKKSCLPS